MLNQKIFYDEPLTKNILRAEEKMIRMDLCDKKSLWMSCELSQASHKEKKYLTLQTWGNPKINSIWFVCDV